MQLNTSAFVFDISLFHAQKALVRLKVSYIFATFLFFFNSSIKTPTLLSISNLFLCIVGSENPSRNFSQIAKIQHHLLTNLSLLSLDCNVSLIMCEEFYNYASRLLIQFYQLGFAEFPKCEQKTFTYCFAKVKGSRR